MTDGVRERILGLLTAGPATVAVLTTRLGVPGGVVSYHLKRLEQDGLVRVGATHAERGMPAPAYVSTSAAAPPPLPEPAPLPALTWTGGRFPVPLWTVPPVAGPVDPVAGPVEPVAGPVEPVAGAVEAAAGAAEADEAADSARTSPATPRPGSGSPPGYVHVPAWPAEDLSPGSGLDSSSGVDSGSGANSRSGPSFGSSRGSGPGFGSGPRLAEVRRMSMDDPTFYEFAARLTALVEEFAARSTPGAPAVDLAITLRRSPGGESTGRGS